MTYKIQQFFEGSWIFVTRAGPTLANAKASLGGYKRSYPSDKYRLVGLGENGKITDIKKTVLRDAAGRFQQVCTGCGVHPADKPSSLCPGCEAYRDHQG